MIIFGFNRRYSFEFRKNYVEVNRNSSHLRMDGKKLIVLPKAKLLTQDPLERACGSGESFIRFSKKISKKFSHRMETHYT